LAADIIGGVVFYGDEQRKHCNCPKKTTEEAKKESGSTLNHFLTEKAIYKRQ